MSGSPAGSFTIVAPAKINLYLHVTGKRDDGYHELDSLVAFAGIQDTLTFSSADDLSLEIDGPFGEELSADPENLVLQAARKLQAMAGCDKGAAIGLSKYLPLASGIGGGSADAAAALKGLSQLWELDVPAEDMLGLALTLGADVPVCLNGQAVFMGGIGERLIPAPDLPTCSVVLVNPGIALSTPAVFKARSELGQEFSESHPFDHQPSDAAELASILAVRKNDLAPAAQRLAPEITDVILELNQCEGALLARMSGSGATCFALFADPGEAADAALKLSGRHPDWWVQAGSLEGDINRLER